MLIDIPPLFFSSPLEVVLFLIEYTQVYPHGPGFWDGWDAWILGPGRRDVGSGPGNLALTEPLPQIVGMRRRHMGSHQGLAVRIVAVRNTHTLDYFSKYVPYTRGRTRVGTSHT